MERRRKITPAQRKRVYLEQIEVLRRGAVFAPKLERERTKALQTALKQHIGQPITADFAINIDEPYLVDWFRSLYLTIGQPVAEKQYERFMHSQQKSFLTDLFEAAIRQYIDEWVATKIRIISASFSRYVSKYVKEAVRDSVNEGDSISELTTRVYNEVVGRWDEVKRWQAMRIVNTETMGAKSVAQHASIESLGIAYEKQWITAFHHSRLWHQDMDGIIVGAGEFFYPDGEKMEYPHDVRFGASAGNLVNCMCDCDYIQKEFKDL